MSVNHRTETEETNKQAKEAKPKKQNKKNKKSKQSGHSPTVSQQNDFQQRSFVHRVMKKERRKKRKREKKRSHCSENPLAFSSRSFWLFNLSILR
jgi:hypothetical protein